MSTAPTSIPVANVPRMPTASSPPSRSFPFAAGPLRGWIAVAVAAAVATAAAGGRAQPPAGDGGEDPLVTVGAERITRGDLDAALRGLGADTLPDGEAWRRATAVAIDQLVEERLLRGEFARRNTRATDAEVDRAVAQLVAQGRAPDDGAHAAIRARLALEIGARKLLLPQLDEAALAATFAKHRRELDGTRLRVSHVVLRPDPGLGADAIPAAVRRAESIRERIIAGGMSFAEAAARHSAGPSRRHGGDLGFSARGGVHHEAFASAAFALEQGAVSRPVVTPFGVHLITVTAVEPGTADAVEVRAKVEQLWLRQAVGDLVARLRQGTAVTYAPGVPRLERQPDDAAAPPRDAGADGTR